MTRSPLAWTFVLVAGLLAISGPVRADEMAKDVTMLSLAAAADLATTHWALDRCPGCYEANPLVPSEPALSMVVKTGAVAATVWGCDRLRRDGHPRWAKALRWGVVAIWGGAAAWNIHQGRNR